MGFLKNIVSNAVSDGIVMKGIENTIRSIGRLGHDGMKGTNEEIIRLMIGE